MDTQHIAIIGGGITGLATAYYLQKEIKKNHLPLRFTLYESSRHWGGKIDTFRKNGYVIEKGPDSFLERKKDATQLCEDLGLTNELVNNEVGQSFIYQANQLHPIPKGSVMGIPTNFTSFLESQLLSVEGKARGLEELLIKPDLTKHDQSVGAFFRSRFGDEMVERIIEPLVSGVYGNTIDRLSLEATYPQYQALLRKYGSLIKAFRQTHQPKGKGIFQTLRSGLKTMVEAIIEELPPNTLIANCRLKRIVRTSEGYSLIFHDGKRTVAQSVILTTPYPVTQKILHPYLTIRPLRKTEPTSAATVAMAFKEKDLEIPFEGTGFIVPKDAGLTLTACTWVHKKWPHTTPTGKALLRCFVGRSDDDQIVDDPDHTIIDTVLQGLFQINGITIKNEPELALVHRLKKARPTYGVGHKQWVKRVFHQVEKRLPQVYLAGSFYHGIGIPDCIRQGRQVVDRIVDSFTMEEKIVIR